MNVAIIGAGAIGCGAAAHLCEHGHEPVLLSISGASTQALTGGAPLAATGAIEGSFRPRIGTDWSDAIAAAEVVMVALPGNGHKQVFDRAAPHLRSGQTVIISGHLSLGALYLRRLTQARDVDVTIVAWGTTVTTGRKRGPSHVHVANIRKRVDMAAVPSSAGEDSLALCRDLFGDRFLLHDDLLTIAVSNLNPQNHMGIALCNLTRMEKGEAWGQNANLTDAVGRLLEALDRERLAIAHALGVRVRTITEHYNLSFGAPVGPVGEMARFLAEKGDTTTGPTTLDTRYVLEDVPFGLVATAWLGRLTGAPAKLHEAGISIFSALYARDLAADNDLLPALRLDAIGVDGLRALCRGEARAG
ncbi:NAD/NADP octopine/nopaline dehydrogenase family protein [Marinivivus vitaminiproducens]|uniref:NAD/NADP octopine/nopaline dehydrogenase family protein n=1 Tax=Marinivivus vitaminiproducens TaxID=3035935 RepID=UPI0027A336EA|nr:NAD/NADP octopine/nopaline dehydrogenase family protein [Geminicoccaceae bacterium SCSIO 64248]